MTIGLYRSPEPWTMGIVETDKQGRVLRFIEKPPKEKITTDQVSAGVLVCKPKVIDQIPNGLSDFGLNIIPKLLKLKKPLWALNTNSYVQDIGTPKRLVKAQKDFRDKKIDFSQI
jgi:NDP-sugar pyrophosphorylase family protein